MIALDTETYLIAPGQLAPPLVCLQIAQDDGPVRVFVAGVDPVRDVAEGALRSGERIVGQNIAYDLLVLARQYPDLMPLVFQAYIEDRITDTQVREKLKRISRGEYFRLRGNGWSLGTLAKRYGFKKDSDDPWRLRYSELWGIPYEEWPADAQRYAVHDVEATRDVYWAQRYLKSKAYVERWDKPMLDGRLLRTEDCFPDEFRQARAEWMLHLISDSGVYTDLDQIKSFEESERALYEKDKAALIEAGLVRDGGTRNLLAARDKMVEVCKALGVKPRLTKKGHIALDEDSCLLSGDETLQAYQRYGSRKNLLTRIQALYLGVNSPINPSFDSLMETGRTSCRKARLDGSTYTYQVQNMRRAAGERECFIPRDGNVFIACDYDTLELRTLAQCCLYAVGQSELARVLNKGEDPHLALAAEVLGLPYDEALAIYENPAHSRFEEVDDARQICKIANFGYPGGMAARTFMDYARGYGMKITPQQAESLRANWFGRWREMSLYFRWIRNMRWKPSKTGKDKTTIVQFTSKRVRGDVPYTAACNSFFQGLAADLAKAAGFALVMACEIGELQGWRVWNFVHDEYILEGPEEDADRAAKIVSRIMNEEGQKWVPDVPITSEPCIMRRWSKKAKPVYVDGKLIPWEDRPDVPVKEEPAFILEGRAFDFEED